MLDDDDDARRLFFAPLPYSAKLGRGALSSRGSSSPPASSLQAPSDVVGLSAPGLTCSSAPVGFFVFSLSSLPSLCVGGVVGPPHALGPRYTEEL